MIRASAEAELFRSSLDTIIFDMDGVLIDITRSIRQVNCLSAPFYLRNVLGWESSDEILTSEIIELYKNAGGFNDDWDLTYAIVLLFLVKSEGHGSTDADYLNTVQPSFEEMTDLIAEEGGGLDAAERILLEPAFSSGIDYDAVKRDYEKPAIRQVFEEMYAGDLCERLYGRPASLYRGRGFVYDDRVLIDKALIPSARKIGMQTGRTYEEAMIGRELCGMDDLLPGSVCATKRDGFDKPDPGGLVLLCERLGTSTGGIYIGDTLDDLRTVRNLNALGVTPPFLIALVLSGPVGARNESLFLEAGADLIGTDVNEVLRWIKNGE